MELNPQLIKNISDIYGEEGRTWLKNLPQLITQLADLWQFQFVEPMPELSYNFVGLVRLKDDQTAVLKMSPGDNLIPEMRWLNCIKSGVPKLYKCDENFKSYLMEHLQPGHSLKHFVRQGNDDEATRIICQTIQKLHSQQCHAQQFRHLSEFTKTISILEGKIESELVSKAQKLFQELTSDRSNDIVLHGDLHHDNILASDSEWKAIDPHGYVGNPAAEVGTMIRNALDCFSKNDSLKQIINRRLQILAAELPYDMQKIKSWAFCITALSGAWSVEDHGDIPSDVIEILRALHHDNF
jgi:streptomycin 6-kinase